MITCPLCGTVPSEYRDIGSRTLRCRCGSLIVRHESCTFGSPTDYMVASQGFVGVADEVGEEVPGDPDVLEESVRDRIALGVIALTLRS